MVQCQGAFPETRTIYLTFFTSFLAYSFKIGPNFGFPEKYRSTRLYFVIVNKNITPIPPLKVSLSERRAFRCAAYARK